MSKIRVLIVDDAVVVRRLVADLLGGDDAIEVIGTAPNGRIALTKIAQLNPDLVTLDLEMPEMDGLETLAALRRTHPHLPVIVVSRLAQIGASITRAALALGANDYVSLPDKSGGSYDFTAVQHNISADNTSVASTMRTLMQADPDVISLEEAEALIQERRQGERAASPPPLAAT